jgi:hypothetical protein
MQIGRISMEFFWKWAKGILIKWKMAFSWFKINKQEKVVVMFWKFESSSKDCGSGYVLCPNLSIA